MRRLRLDCALEVKSVSDDGTLEGLAAVFGNIDFGLDRIERGAFRETLKSVKSVPMLWQHDDRKPIGIFSDLREDAKGLRVVGEINLDVQLGREARSLAKQGAVTGLSIGYFPKVFHYEDDVRVLERVDLVEVSLATFPMNDKARVSGVKNVTNAEFIQMARENLGLSRQAAEALRERGLKGLRDYIGSEQFGEYDDGDLVQRFSGSEQFGEPDHDQLVKSLQTVINSIRGKRQ